MTPCVQVVSFRTPLVLKRGTIAERVVPALHLVSLHPVARYDSIERAPDECSSSGGRAMSAEKILVADEDPHVRRSMRVTLRARGYEVIDSRSGAEALDKFRTELPDLIVLDHNTPAMDGWEICRCLRSASEVPIIIISANHSEREIVGILDAGADDFIAKPIRTEELLARIRALMRRSMAGIGAVPTRLTLEAVEIDFNARRIHSARGSLHLTPKEFALLRYLVSRAGKVVSHRKLLQAIWGPDYDGQVDYLRVFVNQLRKKIEEDPAAPKFIVTEPWVGYRFVLPEKNGNGHSPAHWSNIA